tara:strand:+ start:338 stop:583 length:246 start_codon:yes stop_codon:yes gene_type:complete
MYKYRLVEQEEDKVKKFQDERIMAFDTLESRLENIKKGLRQSKIETIKYYRENPKSYGVVIGTDLVGSLLDDIEILLNPKE